ncbi:MAG: LysM peptidoglycan-binding domain-containing protein [Planctomycetaceae bacterium]|jgi:nucleoid-associated protein YgaU|nr:LysM peptidoglycan-binding domain-containing protein [Planctomycetaceae bacterium]
MSRIVAAFRFLIGLALVAAGAALAGPTIVSLVQELVRHRQAAPAVVAAAAAPMQTPVGQHPAAPPLAMQPPMPAWPPVEEQAIPGPAVPPDPHYQPPPPPAPLPPVTADLAGFAPEVAAAYRSTFAVPPPPLLDAHRPPPLAAGWTAREVGPPPVAEMPAAVVPQTYVIRDGDDLTGIATRFYGHASAATAIWAANRDALPDPNVLPIGAAITLPPAWTVHAARHGDPRAIEPRPAGAAPAMPEAALAMTAARPVGWLTGDRPPAASPATVGPVTPQRPGAVRVAPGETLASLARRFYGDERMAARIWEANRDRLRSPELVVAGMELRLP